VTEDQIYETWAPRDGRWSPWVKPVLFSFIGRVSTGEKLSPFTGLNGAPFSPTTALVVDLPGVDSIAAGITLAALGWRPVPLFNALPAPVIDSRAEESLAAPKETRAPVAVDIFPLIASIRDATPALNDLHLPPTAPPAFLLDARRGAPNWTPRFDTFDNRSISFPTDFPSPTKLREHGITRVLLIQQTTAPQSDLAHTLRQWQEDNLPIELLIPGDYTQPRPCAVRKVTKLGLWWMKLVSFFTHRRARRDVFGRMIAASS
jgi:hypothetical protein